MCAACPSLPESGPADIRTRDRVESIMSERSTVTPYRRLLNFLFNFCKQLHTLQFALKLNRKSYVLD